MITLSEGPTMRGCISGEYISGGGSVGGGCDGSGYNGSVNEGISGDGDGRVNCYCYCYFNLVESFHPIQELRCSFHL